MRSNQLSYPANSIVVIAGAKVRQIIGICKNVLIFFLHVTVKIYPAEMKCPAKQQGCMPAADANR